MPASDRGVAYPLYERVERERVLRGWSSTRLQRETGVARSTIFKWQTQPEPPMPGTVNAVADVLGIDRVEALRLAGILSDAPAPITPQCRYEQELLSEDIPDEHKAMAIRNHRARGHEPWCQPCGRETAPDPGIITSATRR